MDQLIKTLIVQTPSMVVGIVILRLMLRFVREMAKSNERQMDKRDSTLEKVTQQFQESVKTQAIACHSVQQNATEAMKENTKALNELSSAVNLNTKR